MKKYDCSKILDYGHEQRRLCRSREDCYDPEDGSDCPLRGRYCSTLSKITQAEIDILQKWSDEHPEQKLSKKDRAFLACFDGVKSSEGLGCRTIEIDAVGRAFYYYDHVYSLLSGDMFKGLNPNTTMTFEELLELEVEE